MPRHARRADAAAGSITCCIRWNSLGGQIFFLAAVAAHRAAAVLAAAEAERAQRARQCRRLRPPHRHRARVRAGHSRMIVLIAALAAAAPSRCGAIRCGCSSGSGSCCRARPRSTATRLLPYRRITWAAVFVILRRCLRRQLLGAAAASITATGPYSFPATRSPPRLTERFHDATGQAARYVIGSMWDGGNLAHYSPDQPQVLIDGLPRARALDRSRRSARPGRRRGVDRQRSECAAAEPCPLRARRRGRHAVRSADAPRRWRHSMSAGRFCRHNRGNARPTQP